MVGQRGHGQKGKWQVEDVCRFPQPKQSMPKGQLPTATCQPPHGFYGWTSYIKLYRRLLQIQPNQIG